MNLNGAGTPGPDSRPGASAARQPSPRLSLAVQYAMPEPRLPRSRLRRWLQRALDTLAQQPVWQDLQPVNGVQLTLRLVDADEGRSLNLAYRERDYATNVLTFEYGADPDGVWHGDIVLCVPVLEREAAEQGKAFPAHAAHLIVHGLLHALGFDHLEEDEAQAMEALETGILAGMRIADPYEIR
jgi:probable rRNA maturation factor